jgi:hypothetical protein
MNRRSLVDLFFRGAIAVLWGWISDRCLIDFLEGRSLSVGDGKAIAGWLIFRGAIAVFVDWIGDRWLVDFLEGRSRYF